MKRWELLENLLNAADSPAALARSLSDIAAIFSVKHIAYLGVCVPKISQDEPHVMVTYSDMWVQRYKDQNYVAIDPVLSSASQSMLPVDWRGIPVRTTKEKLLFAECRLFGLGNQGVTIPIRGRIGDYALFSLNTNATDSQWDRFLEERLPETIILATRVHERVLQVHNIRMDYKPLSARERDVLRWYGAGKDTLDVAAILNISPNTIRSYAENARHKLQALNRTHAVALAQARGEIPAPM